MGQAGAGDFEQCIRLNPEIEKVIAARMAEKE